MAPCLLGIVFTLIRWGWEQQMAKLLGAGALVTGAIFLAAVPAVGLAAGNAAADAATSATAATNALKTDARTDEVISGKLAMILAGVACAGFVASRRQPRA